jgi:hypothetical protein
MLCNPLLNVCPKLLSLLHEFLRLGLCHHLGIVIVQDVALPPTRIEVACQRRDTRAHRKLHGFERGLVMPCPHHAVARTGNGHFGQLEDGIVGGSKLAVSREAHNPRVLEVARDHSAEAVKLSVACGMRLDAMIGQ